MSQAQQLIFPVVSEEIDEEFDPCMVVQFYVYFLKWPCVSLE